jgi:3-methyladenine DNA glycosylase AlkD
MKTFDEVLKDLQALGTPENIAGMRRYGINTDKTFGVSNTTLKNYARQHGLKRLPREERHKLAAELWNSGWREGKILASIVDEPRLVNAEQLDAWVQDLNSWDVCDTWCGTLVVKTAFAWEKMHQWAARDEEFVRRAGFALLAWLAVHDKKAPNEQFLGCLPLIEQYATDGRNFVKKAVNWSLRQIGKRRIGRREDNKRNEILLAEARVLAERLSCSDNASARWVGRDALREFARL